MFSRTATQENALQTNKVLRNTYALLSMTLLWFCCSSRRI
ncbi:Integral membrane protein, partial [Vibrio splendidus 12B01]